MNQETAIILGSARLEPDLTGALLWRQAGALIVADLHFEKASSYAVHGRHLPPYDTSATLRRLEDLMMVRAPRMVICLGDSFHDRDAAERMDAKDLARLHALTACTDWVWVAGNHDPAIPEHFGGRSTQCLELGGLLFRHALKIEEQTAEISGHFHPKTTIPVRGRHITRPCFIYDDKRVVLPAFGAFTGGLDVRHEAFTPGFPSGFRLAVLGLRKVHWFSQHQIA